MSASNSGTKIEIWISNHRNLWVKGFDFDSDRKRLFLSERTQKVKSKDLTKFEKLMNFHEGSCAQDPVKRLLQIFCYNIECSFELDITEVHFPAKMETIFVCIK